jgi:DNA topoisomerase-1
MSDDDKQAESAAADPEEAARAAGLRYVTDEQPGITRVVRGEGFAFRKPDGSAVTDERALERIRKLAIPPAWEDVWICPKANGHLQATGRDARAASSTATTRSSARCARARSTST